MYEYAVVYSVRVVGSICCCNGACQQKVLLVLPWETGLLFFSFSLFSFFSRGVAVSGIERGSSGGPLRALDKMRIFAGCRKGIDALCGRSFRWPPFPPLRGLASSLGGGGEAEWRGGGGRSEVTLRPRRLSATLGSAVAYLRRCRRVGRTVGGGGARRLSPLRTRTPRRLHPSPPDSWPLPVIVAAETCASSVCPQAWPWGRGDGGGVDPKHGYTDPKSTTLPPFPSAL